MAEYRRSYGKKTILVVDDMGINLRTTKAALEAHFEVRLATSGELALSVLKSQNIDLVLLDFEMPGMTGLDFMRQLKGVYLKRVPPVIFVTAHATPELLVGAKTAGAVDYVIKPFCPETLIKKINDALPPPPPPPEKRR